MVNSESLSAMRSKDGRQRKRRKSGDDSMMPTPTAAHAVSEQQQEKKLKVLEDHLKAMEDIEREIVASNKTR